MSQEVIAVTWSAALDHGSAWLLAYLNCWSHQPNWRKVLSIWSVWHLPGIVSERTGTVLNGKIVFPLMLRKLILPKSAKKGSFFSFDSKLVSFHSVDLWRTSLFFTGIRWGKREWRNSPVCCGCSAVGQCLQAAAPCMWFLYLLFTFLAGSCVSEPCDSPPPPFVAQVPGHWAGCSAAELGTGTAQYKECRPPSRNQGSKQETRRWWWRSSRQQQGNSSCCT